MLDNITIGNIKPQCRTDLKHDGRYDVKFTAKMASFSGFIYSNIIKFNELYIFDEMINIHFNSRNGSQNYSL